jgi:hypothetical protein
VFESNRGTGTIGMPSNDECAFARPITDGLTMDTNATATTSAPTGSCGAMGRDVWFAYTATCTGNVVATFCSGGGTAGFDTVLAAFSGTCGALTQITCNDDFCGTRSQITFAATAGTTYYIAAGSFAGVAGGAFTLAVSCM